MADGALDILQLGAIHQRRRDEGGAYEMGGIAISEANLLCIGMHDELRAYDGTK
jgi:hypothetical protein